MSLQTIRSSQEIYPLTLDLSPYAYRTNYGKIIKGDSLEILPKLEDKSIDLFLTSPPFALQRKKEYGNEDQETYVDWLAQFGKIIYPKLKDSGSFVLDLGGAYQKGLPVRSLHNYRVLLKFCDELGFHLAEEFFWYNPSKLPSPIEWVNKQKIRTKDSVNTVWWFSKTEWPKADVRKVLVPYSPRMQKLIQNPERYYRAKKRPSGHAISTNFAKDNGGAIPSNLLQIPNSESNSLYLRRCKELSVKGHPARFPQKLPEFFINFLTEPGDMVVDIFGGSNTTGYVSDRLQRKWLTIENDINYIATSVFHFLDEALDRSKVMKTYQEIIQGNPTDIIPLQNSLQLF